MPWVLLRTRNKNTGSRVNPTARPCGARPKVANDQVLRVKDPQNMFRGLWTSLGAPKIVQKQLELSLKLSLELSLKLSLELSLKTQLKTWLQTRVTPLIKANRSFKRKVIFPYCWITESFNLINFIYKKLSFARDFLQFCYFRINKFAKEAFLIRL